MIIPQAINQFYVNTLPLVEKTQVRVSDIIKHFCSQNGYLFEDRIKSPESVTEKIETGRYATWSGIDDLYACTIVINIISEEDSVISFLEDKFEKIKMIRRGEANKSPDTFRFDSTRFIGKLKQPTGLEFETVMFEVQVKTVFDFAWAKTTHALAYKSEKLSWQRLRLAAQLKAAVEQLDMLILGFAKTSEYVGQGHLPEIEDKTTIQIFFKEKIEMGLIPSELTPKNWSRFSDNVYRLFQSFKGERPTGHSNQNLSNLKTCLNELNKEINNLGSKKMPRSLSLFQFVTCVIGSLENKSAKSKKHKYSFLVTEEMKLFYPKLNILGEIFELESSGRVVSRLKFL
jgi:ppGpp synthetase/RelA/SpoT-type nucleotidyltranferase